MNRKSRFSAVLIVLLAFFGGWLYLSPAAPAEAPQITFKITDGRRLPLQNLRGQPVLVTFWATSCPGCMREMPHLITLYNEFSGKGLEIIGVAMSYDPPNRVMQMIKKRQIPYPVSLDPDGAIANSFDNVNLTPTSFLIGPDGRIIKHRVGEMDMDRLREQIRKLLSQQLQVESTKKKERPHEPEV